MENATVQRLSELLEKYDSVAIAVGKDPNLDGTGAALALYLSIRQAGKQAVVASPTEPLVAISSLVGIDKVKNDLSGDGGDLVVAFPYREGEIEKVSYTLEDGYLNIVVKASEMGLTFSEKDVQFKRSGGIPSLLFIVGTPRLSDLGNLFNPDGLKNTTIVNIDNKSENQGFGDVVLVSPKFSSVSEQVASMLKSLNLPLDVDIAQNLLSGISFATNNFQDAKTSGTAFEMAGFLMQKGAVRKVAQPKDSQDGAAFSQFVVSQQQQRGFQDKRDKATRPRPWEDRSNQQGAARQQQTKQTQYTQQLPEEKEGKKEEETPPDWLTPKVYRSSNLA